MRPFEFSAPSRIIFGRGASRETGAIAKSLGRRALWVVGQSMERTASLKRIVESRQVYCVPFQVAREPTTALIQQGTALAKSEKCDLVIGVGGGSVLDAAKAIATLLANDGEVLDYLEVIGAGKKIERPSAPWIAIPTTAGTGAEVTRNAVLASPEHRIKASLRGPQLLARAAIVDPELTFDMPRSITASTGLDALTQLIEPFVSHRATPMTDGFCKEGLGLCAKSLRQVCNDGKDEVAREEMSLASLLSGLALANAGLGVVHGFAAAIGGMFCAPHGAICAAILPRAMEINLRALRQRPTSENAVERFDEIARIVTGNSHASAIDGIRWVAELCSSLQIPSLRAYEINTAHLTDIIERTARASSTKSNPIVLSADELREIVTSAL